MRARRAAVFPLLGLVLGACSQTTGSYFAPTAAVVCSPPPSCSTIPEASLVPEFRRILRDPASAQQFRGPQSGQNRLTAQRGILTNLIKETLVKRQASALGVQPSKREVDRAFNEFVRSRFPSMEQFDAARRQQGLTVAELKKSVSDQIVYEKLAQVVAKPPKPPEDELRAFFEQNRASFDEQIRAAHVLVCGKVEPPQKNCAHTPEDEALANSIAERARKGEDFAALAKEFSKDDVTSQSGGDLGYFSQSANSSEFEQAAFALQPGEVAHPVKTQFGFHVIKLVSRGRSFEDARPDIERAVSSSLQQRVFAEYVRKVVAGAKVKLNPKFGEFDSTSQQVVPLKGQVGSRRPVTGAGNQRGQGSAPPAGAPGPGSNGGGPGASAPGQGAVPPPDSP